MRGDDAWLLDMLLAARNAVEFAAPLTFPEFEGDHLRQLAIPKSVEIIGETKAVSPDVPRTPIA